MTEQIIAVLVYAAALDMYTRNNLRQIRPSDRECSAMLAVSDWYARPELLSDPDVYTDESCPATLRCPGSS